LSPSSQGHTETSQGKRTRATKDVVRLTRAVDEEDAPPDKPPDAGAGGSRATGGVASRTPGKPGVVAVRAAAAKSSHDDEDSDDDDEMHYTHSMGPFAEQLNERHFVPPNLLGEFSSHSTRLHKSRSRPASDESSLDMLEYARKADPEQVALQEHEYALARPDVPVPPPGSVAATIGDRSTFLTSQEDNASVDERHLRMMHDRKASSLKRERSEWEEQRGGRVTKERRVSPPV